MIAEPLRHLARPIGEFRLLDGNPRRGDVESVKRSLTRFGQRKPIVVREDGTVEAGNTTLKAALELGWTEIAVAAFGDDDATAKAFALADNRTSELGSFDLAALAAMAVEVQAADPGLLEAASFSEADLNALLAGQRVPPKLNDPDDAPEPPAVPVTRPGDLWELGPHRLLCGDATVVTDQDRLLGDVKPLLMATDPPYGVSYDAEWRGEVQTPLAPNRTGKVSNDDRAEWRDVWAMSPAVIAYVWHGGLHAAEVHDNLVEAGWEIRYQVIWNKATLVMSRGAYHWKHEPCWYAVRKGETAHWVSEDRTQSTVWDAASPIQIMGPKGEEKTPHPTQKPVALWERPILNHLRVGEPLYDPFGGSGTAVIAAHRTQRVAYVMELEPPYCDVICRRYQEHTGTKPVLQSTGQPHDFTA